MPRKSFAFAGPGRRKYPELRDADGAVVGEVKRGDQREFDREWPYTREPDDEWPHPKQDEPEWWPAPDHDWFPAGQELPVRTIEDVKERDAAAKAATSKAPAPAQKTAGSDGDDKNGAGA